MYKAFIFAIALIFASQVVFSQPLKVKKPKPKEVPKFELSLDYRMGNASIYYDDKGNSVSRVSDTLSPIYNSDSSKIESYRKYTFQHTSYSLAPTIKWMPNNEWAITGKIAFSYFTYNEKYAYDSTFVQQKKASYGMFQVEYLSLDADYFLLKDDIKWSIIGGFIMPFGFHNGQMNDPNYNFLSDGAFEVKLGTRLNYVGDGISLTGSAVYNWRDEDLEPLMLYTGKIGLISVPGTELAGYVNYFMPFKDNLKVATFNPRYRALNEETFQVGVSFKMLLDNDMFFQAGYTVNLAGRNTYGAGIFNVLAGVRF